MSTKASTVSAERERARRQAQDATRAPSGRASGPPAGALHPAVAPAHAAAGNAGVGALAEGLRDEPVGESAAKLTAEPQGHATAVVGEAAGGGPEPGTSDADAVQDAPSATYIVPFDRRPLAAPGERIICQAEFTDPHPEHYEIVYTTTGGHFDSATGPTTRTFAGLRTGNLDFFVPTPWDGTATVRLVMQLKRLSDGQVLQTETWNFGKKAYYPTTITQREGDTERTIPAVYTYSLGPARAGATAPFYRHQTILEYFSNWSIGNIQPADLDPTYRDAHSLTSAAAISSHFLSRYSGSNGTFTVDANDRIADQHGGQPNVTNLVSRLAAPKDIHVDLPQTYEAEPGTALGRYTVRRIRKADGTWKVRKLTR